MRHAAHGLLPHTLAGRMEGVALSEEGRAQATRLAEWFAGHPVAAVLSSPVQRARETAAPVAARLGLPVQVAEAWTEIDFGAWTGRRFDDLAADPAWQRWNAARGLAAPPGGEAAHAAQSRALAGLEALRREWPGQAVAVVSHADVIRAALAGVLGTGLERPWRLRIDPAGVSTVRLGDGEAEVVAVNLAAG